MSKSLNLKSFAATPSFAYIAAERARREKVRELCDRRERRASARNWKSAFSVAEEHTLEVMALESDAFARVASKHAA